MYSAIQQQQLLATAYESIKHGLMMGTRPELKLSAYDQSLLTPRATFITLKIDSLLKGCIGSLTTEESLIENLSYNAYSAAFEDDRFPTLTHDELPLLEIEIALLSDLETLNCDTEQDLRDILRPDIDGLALTEGDLSATFLPAIWQQLTNPEQFIHELKLKAGFDSDYWSPSIVAERYTVLTISNKKSRPNILRGRFN
mgnify:CR=1 FL=1